VIRVIDGVPHVRPCRHIPPEGTENSEWAPTPIAVMFERLTTHLPLAGGPALAQAPCGEPRLIAALRDEAPWMAPALDRLSEQLGLQLWAGRPWAAFRPLLLLGPPGAGKSHLARRLGELAGCGSAGLSFAGTHSAVELAGNPRGYKHQQPSFPACAMNRLGTANPVIVVDEVEKGSANGGRDPLAKLLDLLEPSTAARYFDGCLAAEIDLSHVNWVLTANSLDGLPAPLLSRVDVVEVSGPGPEHADAVLTQLWRAAAARLEVPPAALPAVDPAVERALRRLFERTRSVRRMRRAIEALLALEARRLERTAH
jgi:ATP-dependent Lon protease